MGVSHSQDTLRHMVSSLNDVDFYIHVGDLSYADDRDLVGTNPEYEHVSEIVCVCVSNICSVVIVD